DHLLRVQGARAVARNVHCFRRLAAARGCEHALAFDLDHAYAAIAVRSIARLVAKPRDRHTEAVGGLNDRLARKRFDLVPVQAERDGFLRESRIKWRIHANSCGKYLTTHAIGLGAACPKPQIDASVIACD